MLELRILYNLNDYFSKCNNRRNMLRSSFKISIATVKCSKGLCKSNLILVQEYLDSQHDQIHLKNEEILNS